MRLHVLSYIVACTFVCLLTVHTARAAEPQSGPYFDDIIVTTSESHLLLFGELQNSLTDEMLEGLHSGLPVRFSFFVELENNDSRWFKNELESLEFSHALSYDTLKELYVVEIEESSRNRFTTASITEAIRLLNEINGVKIIKLGDLKPDQTYRLRVKADLYKKTLPMSLHNVVPFISWWDLSTDWYTVEFTY